MPLIQNIKTALNAPGDAALYAARAWVNFNGTGVVAIRGSGNVSSITDNGVGDYTINLITPMPDVNYSIIGNVKATLAIATANYDICVITTNNSTSAPRVQNKNVAGAVFDGEINSIVIFR